MRFLSPSFNNLALTSGNPKHNVNHQGKLEVERSGATVLVTLKARLGKKGPPWIWLYGGPVPSTLL